MNNQPINSNIVLYVIGSLESGGTENQLLLLIKEILKDKTFSPQIFVLNPSGPLLSEVKALSIRIHNGGYNSNVSKLKKSLLLLRAFLRLLSVVITENPQVIHGFLPLTNFMAAVCGKITLTKKIVTSRRALNNHQNHSIFWRAADKVSSRLSHVVTANALAVKEDTFRREGGPKEKIRVIHNAIDFDRFNTSEEVREKTRKALSLNDSDVVLIIVANLIPYKGHQELIGAVAALKSDSLIVQLLVVGEDRGSGSELQLLAQNLNVSDQIKWLGLRTDVPELLAASDIYVSASYEEGLSNSLLEALAAGKAIVATKVGGTPELLEQGKFGILVNPRDSQSLAQGIRLIILNKKNLTDVESSFSVIIKNKYSPRTMLINHIMVYQQL